MMIVNAKFTIGLAIAISYLSAGCIQSLGNKQTIASAYDEISKSFFLIAREDMVDGQSVWNSGSGFFVEESGTNYLYTAQHVVLNKNGKLPAALYATNKDGESWRIDLASLEVPHGNHDAARIALDSQIAKPLRIAHRSPAYDESLFFFGDAFGAGVMNAEVGTVVGIGPIEFEHTADIVKGMSGGPIVDAEGVVVGICQKGRKTTAHKNGEALPTDDSKYLKVRKFAVNLGTVKWQRYSPSEK